MQNSESSPSCCDSVCCACELIPPALLQAIPGEYKRIKFEELKDGEDYSRNFLVGRVFQAYPISKRAKGFFRKLLLSEAAEKQDEQKSAKKLNMFILNENEKQLDSIDQKSFVAVSGFKVENVTCKSGDDENFLPVQVLVIIQSDSSDSTMMWIARSVAPALNDDSTCSPSQDSGDESMDCNDPQPLSPDEEDFHALVREYSQREQSSSDESDEISIESDESPPPPQLEKYNGGLLQKTKSKSPKKNTGQKDDDIDEQANPVPESSSRHYTYLQISELKESLTPDQNFNIYGIVVNCYFKPSSPDRDKLLELVLRDSTTDFFRCRVIGRCTDKFPDVYPGDIIRIHRMLVDKFRERLKGKCFSPKFIIVFDGKTNDYEPRCVAKTFVFTQDDKKMVQNLRLLGNKKQDVKLISEIEMDDFVTVICQVVSIFMVRDESVLLKVWDGTSSAMLMNEKNKNFMRGKTDERLFNVAKNYLVPVWVNGDYSIAAAELKAGQYIKICDVHSYAPKSKPDEPRLCVHPQTKPGRGIELLDATDSHIQDLKNRLQKIWDEASVMEEITMNDTPSFMKDVDTSNVVPKPTNDNTTPDGAISRINEPGTSGENVHAQENIDASEAMKAADLASQQLLISALNQGIEPASSMQLTTDSQVPLVHDSLSPHRENMDRITVDEGWFSPSDNEKSPTKEGENERSTDLPSLSDSGTAPAAKEAGKRPNSDSDVDNNANKKRKVDNHDQNAVAISPIASPKDTAPNISVQNVDSESVAPASSHSPTTINASHIDRESSSPWSSSNILTQPDWWKSVKPVSASIGHQHIRPTFLNNVVKHFVPYKFRLFVTVLNIEPQLDTTQKLVHLHCPTCHYLSEDAHPNLEVYETRNEVPFYLCPDCLLEETSAEDGEHQKQVLEYTFLASFTLHDGTSMIEAYLWRENAVKFFKGIRPEDTMTDSSQATLVQQMLWDICPNCCPCESTNGTSLGSNNNVSYYPILDCCIMSYTAGGKTRYQIFDSKLN